jgi:hypothetical protein
MATLGTMRNEVLASLGQPNDGALNPSLLVQVDRALVSAQRQLQIRFPWLALSARAKVAWGAGVQSLDLPAGIPLVIGRAWFDTGSTTYPLEAGIDPHQERSFSGAPQYWTVLPTQRFTGTETTTGAATIMLYPTPNEAGTLILDYSRTLADLSEDADVSLLDVEVLVLHAAAHLAPSLNPGAAAALLKQYGEHVATVSRRQGTGRGWTMSREPARRR